MSLSPGQRIAMINECATLLDKSDWQQIDLVLGQHGLPITDFFQGDSRRAYVIQMIQAVSDGDLERLHEYLTGESDDVSRGRSPFKEPGRLRLFMSHLAEHREAVGQVGQALERYGIEAFVAHDSIEPSSEWQAVIEAALATCDAMAAFLHPAFGESKWCDQEVGWALARRRPFIPLNYGIHPYGFMGKYQDLSCFGKNEWTVADLIVTTLLRTPTLHGALSGSLSAAFAASGSYDRTRKLAGMLESIQNFSEDELAVLERAALENNQISDCWISGVAGPDWVSDFVAGRRAPTSQPIAWPSPADAPF